MKLSNFVLRQIPDFVKESHPKFVKFIQTYYEFLEVSLVYAGSINGGETQKFPRDVVAQADTQAGDFLTVGKPGYFKIGPTSRKYVTYIDSSKIIVFTKDGSTYTRSNTLLNAYLDKDLSTNFISNIESIKEETQSDVTDVIAQANVLVTALSNELAYNLPKPLIETEFFLQRAVDLYHAKGSEEAFRFLFRVLFDREVEIVYPSQDILKTSDGTWTQDFSIFVRSIAGNVDLMIDNIADVLAKDQRVKVSTFYLRDRTLVNNQFTDYDMGYIREIIESVVELGYTTQTVDDILDLSPLDGSYSSGIFEIFVDRNYYGKFNAGDIVLTKDAEGKVFIGSILSVVEKAKVYDGGKGFRVGDLIDLETSTGKGTTVKVTEIGEEGSIKYVDFIKFGYEYKRPFVVTVTNQGKVNVILERKARENDSDFNTTATIEDQTGGNVSRGYTLLDYDYSFDDNCVVSYQMESFGEGYTEATVTFSDPELPNGITAEGTAIIQQKPVLQLSGTIRCNVNSPIVESFGDTKFLSELSPGDLIVIPYDTSEVQTINSGVVGKVLSVQSNTRLTLTENAKYSRFRSIAQKFISEIVGINITNKGSGYTSAPTITFTGNGLGATATSFLGNDNYFDLDYCGEISSYFKYNRIKRIDDDLTKAMIELTPGPVAKYAGYYRTSNGFLSDSTVLQDGEYYQDFSYSIVSNVRLSEYESYLKGSIHPSGMALFGEYSLDKNITELEDAFGLYITYTRSYNMLLDDSADAIENLEFTDVVYDHELLAQDGLSTDDYGYVVDDPYTMPYSPESYRMWQLYTEGDDFVEFDDNP